MTEALFRDDAYLQHCEARVVNVSNNVVVLDRTVCYPLGGGQPGDSGELQRADGSRLTIVDTRKGEGTTIHHWLADDATPPAVGEQLEVHLDWDRRHRHMRMHTGLHLLGSVLKFGVTGGSIGADRSRLDFDMQDAVDKDAVNTALAELIAADLPVQTRWITDAELEAKPELIRTMSVQPPRGAGRIRLLEIPEVDLQPCGGTHVRRTGEIGGLVVAKVSKKGRHNRRVSVVFAADASP